MNELLEPATAPRATAPQGFLLHCGATTVSRDAVAEVQTPIGTASWYPLAHTALVCEVETQLLAAGFQITGEAHALSHEGSRYFGLLAVETPGGAKKDYTWTVGLRNSHDKSYPAGLVAGTRVFVCDNLSFCGEVAISRKHTRFAVRDLKHLTSRAVGQLGDKFHHLDRRIGAYREHRLNDRGAHDLIVRALDCRALTTTQIPDVLHEWRTPRHEEFAPRTAWSLFNAATEVMKGGNPYALVARSQALHGLFDGLVGLS